MQIITNILKLNNIDIITADISNDKSMDDMCSKTRVIISTTGPFDKIGTPVIVSCVRCETNYVDITGESQWIRKIIDRYHIEARNKKLKLHYNNLNII